jgi:hypothetical protein
MSNLCPECAYILYDYKNCEHQFLNGRCVKCYWNGNKSAYINKLATETLNKSRRIIDIVKLFQNKYGESNIIITDNWITDKDAIGLSDKTEKYLAYISTISDKDDNYFLALENPSTDKELPYSPAGNFDNISLLELEALLTKHLGLSN